jgi:hypothetical protein
MTEPSSFDEAVRELASDVIAERRSALAGGLFLAAVAKTSGVDVGGTGNDLRALTLPSSQRRSQPR